MSVNTIYIYCQYTLRAWYIITYSTDLHYKKSKCNYSLYLKPSWEIKFSMECCSLLVRQNIVFWVKITSNPQSVLAFHCIWEQNSTRNSKWWFITTTIHSSTSCPKNKEEEKFPFYFAIVWSLLIVYKEDF